jgi:hypothetical protein
MSFCARCGQDIPMDVDHCINLSCRKAETIELQLEVLQDLYKAAKLYHRAYFFGNGRSQSTTRKALLKVTETAMKELEDI